MRAGLRVGAMIALFGALTAIGIAIALPKDASLPVVWQQLAALSGPVLAAVALLSLGVIAAEMGRHFVAGWALGLRLSAHACFDATVATYFFSWITPGVSLGEPAAVIALRRHGVPLDAAVIIAFGKLALSMVVIFGATFLLLVLGEGPPLPSALTWAFSAASLLGALPMLVLWIGAPHVEWTRDRLRRIEQWLLGTRLGHRSWIARLVTQTAQQAQTGIERLAMLRAGGAQTVLVLLLSQVIYFASYISILVVLSAAFGTKSVARTITTSVVYLGFQYLAPTPGAAGIGEATASPFFGSLLSPDDAFVTVVLFRALTFYLHVAIGAVYLPIMGSVQEFLRRPHLKT